jgi:hypothetical protein
LREVVDMKHLFRRAGGGAAVLLGAFAVNAGCSEEETGLFIVGNVQREPPDCLARPEANTTLVGTGFLDVGLSNDYDASLLVGNQLTPRGDKENLRTETMITTITGAEVQVYDDVGALVAEFTVPATGTIRPDSSEDPGFGIVNVTLIPASVADDLRNEIDSRALRRTRITEVRVFGETIGGLEVESAPITYVIRVCEGCLVFFPAESLDMAGGCNNQLDQGAGEVPCRPGQDEAIDCRLCRGNNGFCQTVEDIEQL